MSTTLDKPKFDLESAAQTIADAAGLRLEWPSHQGRRDWCHLHHDAERWHVSLSGMRLSSTNSLSAAMNWPDKTAAGFTLKSHEACCSISISAAKKPEAIGREILTRLVTACRPVITKILDRHQRLDAQTQEEKAILNAIGSHFPDKRITEPLNTESMLTVRREHEHLNIQFEMRSSGLSRDGEERRPYVRIKGDVTPDLAQKIAELIALQTRPDRG